MNETTPTDRTTANPRRTTLMHLENATSLLPETREYSVDLPAVTANPRRTVLMVAPQTPVAS
ncbi:hypothetical protein ACN20G_05585 [Streptomyces sp. BI20]|uniref:hypothetical protein n=1 Tax=Streptomyces sp. BI20 TaxID=3403460 RepID=UPI003C7871A6